MKNNNFSKTKIVLNTSIVLESILKLERKIGILLPMKDLFKQIKDDTKKHNEKMRVKDAKEIIYLMLLAGIVFYPKKNYVERVHI